MTTTKAKTTNRADEKVAKLERELEDLRRENSKLQFVRRETLAALVEVLYGTKDDNRHVRRTQILEYVRHLGVLYPLPLGWENQRFNNKPLREWRFLPEQTW